MCCHWGQRPRHMISFALNALTSHTKKKKIAPFVFFFVHSICSACAFMAHKIMCLGLCPSCVSSTSSFSPLPPPPKYLTPPASSAERLSCWPANPPQMNLNPQNTPCGDLSALSSKCLSGIIKSTRHADSRGLGNVLLANFCVVLKLQGAFKLHSNINVCG
ncbi:hypothetical protein B0H16DRAFT_1525324 [Mycena metata]|uniref:Uncharacterized protein n=1 Tax=Mycena metata TaxID=1033252 RepID=A0AAD7JKP7_9AGAR|nr:hypothetical protein B0H16DRAFT_1525324 [Mycena metata]